MARHPTSGFDLPAAVADPARAEAGETVDLEAFFRRYAPYVAKIGYRLLGRRADVDDLVQDVFLAAHQGIRQLREPAAVRGWLATVTVRTARRRLRTRRLRAAFGVDASPDYDDIADDAASPEQRALLAAVYRALDGLPANERLAWTLRYIEGERLERVAQLCGCSLATAKRRIKAGQDTIRLRVVGPDEGPGAEPGRGDEP